MELIFLKKQITIKSFILNKAFRHSVIHHNLFFNFNLTWRNIFQEWNYLLYLFCTFIFKARSHKKQSEQTEGKCQQSMERRSS